MITRNKQKRPTTIVALMAIMLTISTPLMAAEVLTKESSKMDDRAEGCPYEDEDGYCKAVVDYDRAEADLRQAEVDLRRAEDKVKYARRKFEVLKYKREIKNKELKKDIIEMGLVRLEKLCIAKVVSDDVMSEVLPFMSIVKIKYLYDKYLLRDKVVQRAIPEMSVWMVEKLYMEMVVNKKMITRYASSYVVNDLKSRGVFKGNG